MWYNNSKRDRAGRSPPEFGNGARTMAANEQQFRGAVFGGFQKQDVLGYIETTAREHGAKTEALQKELSELTAAKAALEAGQAELVAKAEVSATALVETAAALERATAELEQKNTRLAVLERENTDLKARLAVLEPAAAAYQAVKDRTAGIELEAHCRAQAAESAAQEHIKAAKADLEQWMLKVQSGYDRLRTDVDATISHAGGELARVARTLEGISAEFCAHDEALEGLIESYRETQGPRPPMPLSVDGD
jgi:chromosome segregation ATPase